MTIERVDPDAPLRRPLAVVLLFVLYLLVAGLFGATSAGVGKGAETSALVRVLLGAGAVALLLACAGILARAGWTRTLCIAIHAAACVIVIGYGIATWGESAASATRQTIRIVLAVAFQIGCIERWMRADVVRWMDGSATRS